METGKRLREMFNCREFITTHNKWETQAEYFDKMDLFMPTGSLDPIPDYEESPNPYNTTSIFQDLARETKKEIGLYSFWNKQKEILYIGKSKNLGRRIHSSYGDKFKNTKPPIYIRLMILGNEADACFYETYLIALIKPPYNTTGVCEDYPSIRMSVPKWEPPIRCNNTTKGVDYE